MELYLLRHPRVCVPEGTCYGVTDLALADPPRDFANACKAGFPNLSELQILTSDLQRCRKLAGLLGDAGVDTRLREMDFGAWENRPWQSLPRRETQAWIGDICNHRPSEGECYADVLERVRDLVAEASAKGKSALWVTHAGVIRAALAVLLDLPAESALQFDLDYGGVSKVRRCGDSWRLIYWNRAVGSGEF